jgi:plastocyanin
MKNVWIWIVIIVILGVGGFMWWQNSQSASMNVESGPVETASENTGVPNTVTASDASSTATVQVGEPAVADTVTITYDGKAFTPAQVTIKKGDTVKFKDADGKMWVASGPHPGHTGYDGTSRSTHCAQGYNGPAAFDQCVPGESYSFTFDKAGTWPYHDHVNASAFGKIVVTE